MSQYRGKRTMSTLSTMITYLTGLPAKVLTMESMDV